MKKVYDDANDKNVASYIVYGDSTDNKLYHESTGSTKTQVTEAELNDLFTKRRLIIVSGDVVYSPVKVEGNVATCINVSSDTIVKVEFEALSAS